MHHACMHACCMGGPATQLLFVVTLGYAPTFKFKACQIMVHIKAKPPLVWCGLPRRNGLGSKLKYGLVLLYRLSLWQLSYLLFKTSFIYRGCLVSILHLYFINMICHLRDTQPYSGYLNPSSTSRQNGSQLFYLCVYWCLRSSCFLHRPAAAIPRRSPCMRSAFYYQSRIPGLCHPLCRIDE